MNDRLQVTFRHMPVSDAIRELAEQKLVKLRNQFPDASQCHVVLDCPAFNHHRKGSEFRAQVEMTVGRTHMHISAESSHEDAYTAVRQAFDAVRRQAETRSERQVG